MCDLMDKKIALKDDLLYEIIDGEAVIVLNENNSMISLNRMGTEIFSILRNSASFFNRLFEYVCDNYDIDRETATMDLKEFITSLREYGLIVVTEE